MPWNTAGTLNAVAKPKKTAKYDLKAADRKRNLLIQIGLTAVVVVFAAVLVFYIVMNGNKKPATGEAKAIRVASSNVITKEGTSEPKVVLSFYEDFLCPACGAPLEDTPEQIACPACEQVYPVKDGIYDFRLDA